MQEQILPAGPVPSHYAAFACLPSLDVQLANAHDRTCCDTEIVAPLPSLSEGDGERCSSWPRCSSCGAPMQLVGPLVAVAQ
jgi:hypothetical protein